MSKLQRLFLVLALICLGLMLLWVPYKASHKWAGEWQSTAAGYNWIFVSPSQQLCISLMAEQLDVSIYRLDRNRCKVNIDTRQLFFTLAAAAACTFAVLLLIGIARPRDVHLISQRGERKLEETIGAAHSAEPRSELVQYILRANPNLPIGMGDLSRESPLVISVRSGHVAIEYTIIDIIHKKLNGFDSELKTQEFIEEHGRYIDCLTYRYRKDASSMWDMQRKYYFDITAGIEEMRRKMSKRWWEVWK